MKPSNSSTPRPSVTCQVIRFWSAVRSENAPPAHHLRTCENCRQFLVSTEQLHLGLRHGALQSTSSFPEEIEKRIIEAIRVSPASRGREPQHRSLLRFAVAGGAVAFVFAGLWHFNLTPFPGPNPETGGEYAAEVIALVAAVRSLPTDLSQNLAGSTAQLAENNSLNREVENVYSDARSALSFLALNFLPAATTSDSTNRSQTESQRI